MGDRLIDDFIADRAIDDLTLNRVMAIQRAAIALPG
jgi:hypothetical protein